MSYGQAQLQRVLSNQQLWRAVQTQLFALAGGHGELISHASSNWSSITFSGTRHEIVLDFRGHEAVEAGEKLIEALSEHEFSIPGQLVAEAYPSKVDQRFGTDKRLRVTCVLLLLEED